MKTELSKHDIRIYAKQYRNIFMMKYLFDSNNLYINGFVALQQNSTSLERSDSNLSSKNRYHF